MKEKIILIVEIAILLLCVGIVYSLTEGFSSFQVKSLADKAEEIMEKGGSFI